MLLRGPLFVCLAALVAPAPALEHPFILWNREDLTALRELVATADWAKTELAAWADKDRDAEPLRDCFRYAVLDDAEAGRRMRAHLERTLASPVPRGGAQWLNVVRYDLLHHELDADTREAFAAMARTYIRNAIETNAVFDPEIFNDERDYSRYDAHRYTRSNWLPNIIGPRKVSANLLALVLRDEELIRRTWDAYGSWRWYFDAYLADTGFYCEEFGKMGSMPGAMLLYCRGLERLGLDELGFGYTGAGGATMRGHIRSLIHLGYPAVDLGSERPHLPMLTLGDLRSGSDLPPTPAFQRYLVCGYLPDGSGGRDRRWQAHGAWGGEIRGNHAQWDGYSGFTPKMQLPLWFEIAHRRWPEDGYGFFLAGMRPPERERHRPSLFFGCPPLAPADAAPPPAPSGVWPERGLVMLRHDESPSYWTGPGPAVGMRLATPYAHHVRDSFALCGYYAHNRPIYLNRQVTPGYARDWSRSVQSHCAVAVDPAWPEDAETAANMNAFVRAGEAEPGFTEAVALRHRFSPPVKFAAARSAAVYPGVDYTRALLLTGDYLVDVAHLVADEPHRYAWLVHALGVTDEDDGLAWADGPLPEGLKPLANSRVASPGERGGVLTVRQRCTLPDPSPARLPDSWYARGIGVRIHLCGAPGLTLHHARTPLPRTKLRVDGRKRVVTVPSEVGGVTAVAGLTGRRATFAAVHAPFVADAPRLVTVERLPSTPDLVVLRLRGEGIDDLAAIALGDRAGEVRALEFPDGGDLSFRDHCWLRRDERAIRSHGGILALELTAPAGRPLLHEGERVATAGADGCLVYAGR